MSTDATEREDLQTQLKTKRICRFCLTQNADRLGSIFTRDGRIKASAPLPLQIMACASIEVLSNDGMPCMVCCDCRLLFEHSYRFKQMCKRAETLLRQVPLTGVWPQPLAKPKYPLELSKPNLGAAAPAAIAKEGDSSDAPTASKQQYSLPPKGATQKIIQEKRSAPSPPMKLLNSNPVDSPEPPVPKRVKKEKYDVDEEAAIFLNKVENDEELSIDDVQRLIAATSNDEEFIKDEVSPPKAKTKPKLLNKSTVRILNREADVMREPRLSVPQVKCDSDGNMAIVTEILDPDVPYDTEPDPIKNAAPVETNVFPCPHCERSFPLLQLRDIHLVNHNRERSYQCGDCDKSFFSKYDLQKHSLTHTGDRPFKCSACYKSFTRATLLHRHEKIHTDIPKFICVYCEKPFISKDEMEKHTERHRKNRPYQCKICNKSFAFKQGLERHEVVHLRDQPYPCQYCEQSFSTPSKLARHLTAHAGKRPYPCKFCSKSYLLSHHLTRHLRSHKAGKVSFDCNECGKVFNTRDELVNHSTEHAKLSLACPLCKENFKHVDDVTEHIRKHADGEAYACEFCDLIFMTSEQLTQHTDNEHALDMKAYLDDDRANDKDFQQTINEFLIDELPEGVQIVGNDIIEGDVFESITIKQEPNATTTQAVEEEHCNNDEGLRKKRPRRQPSKSPSYAAEKQETAPPMKVQKLDDAPNSAAAVRKVTTNSDPLAGPVLRRKLATQSTHSKAKIEIKKNELIFAAPQPKQQIKIEKNVVLLPAQPKAQQKAQPNLKQPLIDKVLNSLPKGLSVRLNSASGSTAIPAATASTSSSASTPATGGETKSSPTTRASAVKNGQLLKSSAEKVAAKKSLGKVEEIMVNNKKVKVQRIVLSKSEADAMAKEGRIHLQDGNMVFTSKAGILNDKKK